LTYTGLINKTLEMYKQGRYIEAYEFITKNCTAISGVEAQVYNFRYSLACKAGLESAALEIMKEAILGKGYWYSYDYLMSDEDLDPLHKYAEFIEFAGICKDRETDAKRNSKPDLTILGQENGSTVDRRPLLIALHGNQESSAVTEKYWSSCLSHNFLLALPRSSQIEFSGGYSWGDVKKGSDELRNHYEMILGTHGVDTNNVIVGGFSAGARVALYAILNDAVNVKGFVFVGPWVPEIEEWEPLLNKLKVKGIKGYVICGDRDDDCLECTKKFVELLNKHGVPNTFKIVSGLSHDYPDNFQDELHGIISALEE
jgi:predicted esterase